MGKFGTFGQPTGQGFRFDIDQGFFHKDGEVHISQAVPAPLHPGNVGNPPPQWYRTGNAPPASDILMTTSPTYLRFQSTVSFFPL